MTEQELLDRLQALPERDLTERVVAPLFQSLGYSRVVREHGPHERGRDLICWREDVFGRTEVAAVQVKTLSPSTRTLGRAPAREVVLQLTEALHLPVANVDGTSYLPAQAILVTPYSLSAYILDYFAAQIHQFGGSRIVLIDGPRLATLLRQNLPRLVDALLGVEPGGSIGGPATLFDTTQVPMRRNVVDFLAALREDLARLVGPEDIADPRLCFVIMSFSRKPLLADFYEKAVKPTIEKLGYRCERVDEQQFNGRITERIYRNLRAARFVVADLTEARPNCYYELGVAHALRKEVIHLAYSEDPDAIQFDVKDFNFIIYSRIDDLAFSIRERVLGTVGFAEPNETRGSGG
jgi:hypothetical protein